MMKKTRIVFWIIIAIIAIPAFNFLRTFNFLRDCNKILKDMKGQLTVQCNNDNFPEFAKNFKFSEHNIANWLEEKTLYDPKSQEKIIQEIQNMLPENIKEYQTELVPSILELMKKEKTNKYPTAEETENFPALPTHDLISSTTCFWANLSLLLSKQGDNKTSLLISHGIFYLIRELESSYAFSGAMIQKLVWRIRIKYASKAILVWASNAHHECQELSMLVAKDILKLVEAEYPLTRNYEFNKYSYDNILKHFAKKTSLVGSNVFNKSYYKEVIDLTINGPIKIESQLETKSYYEIKDEYTKYEKILRDANESGKYAKIFPNYFINPEKAIVYSEALLYIGNIEKERMAIEESLGYMEFAAIALLINSYYCQNGNLPQNLEELEKWFGQKLPVSRFDNKPYVIDTKSKHLLTFKHMNNEYSRDQLYFDFFK